MVWWFRRPDTAENMERIMGVGFLSLVCGANPLHEVQPVPL
jgi:hypothetical protein